MAAELPLPRGNTVQDVIRWLGTLVNYLRKSEVRVEAVVNDVIEPIVEDQTEALEAAADYAVVVQDAITAAGGHAQEVFDEYTAAAAAGHAQAAQFYLTEAANRVEAFVRVSENEVISTNIDTVAAYLAGSAATITTIQEAVANGDTAIATQISTVQTQANGNTAALVNIVESAGGTDVNYGLIATANGQIKAAFNMQSGALGSDITFIADRLIIAHPTDEGDLITPFVAGLVNGLPTVGIAGATIVDGSIIARHIAAESITADKLDVGDLSAITANVGTVTAGRIESANGISYFDLNTGEFQIAVEV